MSLSILSLFSLDRFVSYWINQLTLNANCYCNAPNCEYFSDNLMHNNRIEITYNKCKTIALNVRVVSFLSRPLYQFKNIPFWFHLMLKLSLSYVRIHFTLFRRVAQQSQHIFFFKYSALHFKWIEWESETNAYCPFCCRFLCVCYCCGSSFDTFVTVDHLIRIHFFEVFHFYFANFSVNSGSILHSTVFDWDIQNANER